MLKNKERMCTSLPFPLYKKLKDYSKNTMIPMSRIIEKAIEEYLRTK